MGAESKEKKQASEQRFLQEYEQFNVCRCANCDPKINAHKLEPKNQPSRLADITDIAACTWKFVYNGGTKRIGGD